MAINCCETTPILDFHPLLVLPSLTPVSDEPSSQPTRAEAEAAVRTLIRWAGDDPTREGLLATPARVVRAYEAWFASYRQDPFKLLNRTFGEVGGYDDAVILRDISLQSPFEPHVAAIRGIVQIAYCRVSARSSFPSSPGWSRRSDDCRSRSGSLRRAPTPWSMCCKHPAWR